MSGQTTLIIIIAILCWEFILTKVLAYLNTLNWSEKLPKEAEWIYTPEEYEKSQKYEKTKHKFSTITTIFSFIIMLLVISLWWFWFLDIYLRKYIDNQILLADAFFWIIVLSQTIINIPFSYYSTFVIEEKFGFNKSTKKLFILDTIKSLVLSFVIWFLLLSVLVFIYLKLWIYFWLVSWGIMTVFTLLFMLFYSSLIVPLFNQQIPLQDQELKKMIEEFAKKVDFKVQDIYEMDASKRSSKWNAYFSWFWPKKRIVLFDTLLKDLTREEVVAVLAHEIWHYKRKHTIQMLVFSTLQTWFIMFIFSILLSYTNIALALWTPVISFHIWLIAFTILFTPISIILSLISSVLSRKNEYQADEFAWTNYDASFLQSALKKLSKNNLSNLKPHFAYEFFYYSHPTVLKRLSFLEKFKKIW